MKKQEEFKEGLLWYSKEDGYVTIGITDAALVELGSILNIDLPDLERTFSLGDWVGEIEGREGSVQVEAPMDFEIEEINQAVKSDPSILEDDPTGDAWLVRGIIQNNT